MLNYRSKKSLTERSGDSAIRKMEYWGCLSPTPPDRSAPVEYYTRSIRPRKKYYIYVHMLITRLVEVSHLSLSDFKSTCGTPRIE